MSRKTEKYSLRTLHATIRYYRAALDLSEWGGGGGGL